MPSFLIVTLASLNPCLVSIVPHSTSMLDPTRPTLAKLSRAANGNALVLLPTSYSSRFVFEQFSLTSILFGALAIEWLRCSVLRTDALASIKLSFTELSFTELSFTKLSFTKLSFTKPSSAKIASA